MERQLHFAMRDFNLVNLVVFFREIQKVEYFDSILAPFLIQDFLKNYNTIQGSNRIWLLAP